MPLLPPPKAIIFDWDNTLVNTWPIIHEALNATFAHTGKPLWTLEEVKERVHKSMRDSFPEIFGESWQAAGDFYQQQYRANHLKLQPLPQAMELLQRVKERELFSVVVSNKRGVNLRKEVEHLGWGALFDTIVGADDAQRDKPHADPVQLAFKESNIAPGHEVWFIGDSEIDLECAMGVGCTAILYGETARAHPEFTETHYRGFPYHAHVHHHHETMALLEQAV